jgi:hypothetical protein
VIAEAEEGEQPPAPPQPEVAVQPQEQPIQIIRVGAGCMACPPGERQPTEVQSA